MLYDSGSQSYVLNDIVKRGRKKWTKFQHDRPTFTVGVRDMAAFVSNLRGVVKDFYFNDYFNNMNIELFTLHGILPPLTRLKTFARFCVR